MQAYFGWAKPCSCSCSWYCFSRHLWFYDSGRLGRVEKVALTVVVRAKEGKGGGGGAGWKHYENEKHPLIRRAWPLFWKWVADNNKTTKQSLQSKDSHCLKKNKLVFIIVFIRDWVTMQLHVADEASVYAAIHSSKFISLNRYPWEFNILQTILKKLMSWAQCDTTLQENITFSD